MSHHLIYRCALLLIFFHERESVEFVNTAKYNYADSLAGDGYCIARRIFFPICMEVISSPGMSRNHEGVSLGWNLKGVYLTWNLTRTCRELSSLESD